MPESQFHTISVAHSAVPVILVAEPYDRITNRRAAMARIGLPAEYVDDPRDLAVRLATDWSIDVLLLDLAMATPDLIHRLVGLRLANSGPAIVVMADAASADLAGAAFSSNIVAFVDRDVGDDQLEAVLLGAGRTEPAGVAEISDRELANIGALSREVERIAAALATMAQNDRTAPVADHIISAARIRGLLKARRTRERFFPIELFSDPAWDMLLDLTAARIEGQPVSVSSLCIAAAVPTTTALRWIRNLCDAGLFERRVDDDDARRTFITISDTSFDAMRNYLGAIGAGVDAV